MSRSIRVLKHILRYVKTHKKRSKISGTVYYQDIPTLTSKRDGVVYLILYLDSYYEYIGEFSDVEAAIACAQVHLKYYTGYMVYSNSDEVLYQHFTTISFTLPDYKFKPKEI